MDDWYDRLLAAAAERLDVDVSDVAAVLNSPDGDLKPKLFNNAWTTWLAISTASCDDIVGRKVQPGHAGLLKRAFPGNPSKSRQRLRGCYRPLSRLKYFRARRHWQPITRDAWFTLRRQLATCALDVCMLRQPELTLGGALAVLAVLGQCVSTFCVTLGLCRVAGSHDAGLASLLAAGVLERSSYRSESRQRAPSSSVSASTGEAQSSHESGAASDASSAAASSTANSQGARKIRNRNRGKQQRFREALIKRYSPTTQSNKSTVYCMLSHMELPAKTVKAAHLWKSEWSLKDPSLTAEVMGDEESWRNGLLLAQPLQDAFDAGHLCLVKKPNGVFRAFVLEQNLILRTLASRLDQGKSDVTAAAAATLGKLTFGDIDGRVLRSQPFDVPVDPAQKHKYQKYLKNPAPQSRALHYHALRTLLRQARSLSWANFKLKDLVLKVHMDDDNQEEAGNWGLSEARLAERVRFGTPSWRERVELLFRAAS
ncbi:hypothetical protein JKP88DRAFT_326114 [Tribonema minus]|uniref:HNH nuclease domain-containing protein n=1 Tax=Tribonema minus TaxID=303371 RepID=A0A835YQC7_9STRA|nr:hypothetical protein JKP88DRAFT_326114 [Tribonema minus]